MFLQSVILLLLQGLSGDTANVRIVSEPNAPAVLIGKPCEEDPNDRIVPLPVDSAGGVTDVLFGPVHSDAYECELGCHIGLQVRDRRTPVWFRIGEIQLLSRGAYIGPMDLPSIRVAASPSCGNTPVTAVKFRPGSDYAMPVEGFLLYLEEVQFADGSKWRLSDRQAFAKMVTRKWQEEKLRPNRSPGR